MTFDRAAVLAEYDAQVRRGMAYRGRLATARGYRYLQVDASAESRPILERLGFACVAMTTPYTWSPA